MISLGIFIIIMFLVTAVIIYQINKINEMNNFTQAAIRTLAYYQARFGFVKWEDINNNVGITRAKVKKYIEEASKAEIKKKLPKK